MTGDSVVIGVGNGHRRDDGVGPAVAAAVGARVAPGVRVRYVVDDPCEILDAWAGARLAVVVDAAVATPSVPGRIHRCTADRLLSSPPVSSHGMDLATVVELGRALNRMPHDLLVLAVEVADVGFGVGLSTAVQAAVPDAVDAVLTAIRQGPSDRRQGSKCPGRVTP
ncbi:peptidase M52 [Mycobacterium sp. IS-1742]|uniref:hydrogenase maturation protease n=1 Tax=Mycobacterium sp. IS-1742 TaxID=1772285 RepID=UPI00073FEB4E|nr:hydrogenase maturation protease [Mycobacterium sp. IS-1742]KUI30358.1 peptidase M52 [Mycobacterium sp. IS-1742]